MVDVMTTYQLVDGVGGDDYDDEDCREKTSAFACKVQELSVSLSSHLYLYLYRHLHLVLSALEVNTLV